MRDPHSETGSIRRLGSRFRRLRTGAGYKENEAALRVAYREHGAELFRLALRSLGDRGLAEEVVQETFVRAWRNSERFDAERGSLRTWLFTIARNLIVDTVRARDSRPPGPPRPKAESQTESKAASGRDTELESDTAGGEDPEDQMETVVQRLRLEEALSRLSEDHRLVIVEIHYQGRSYTELSEELGVPAGTLRSRMYYALKALRLTLEETERSHDE